jgi:hypothetical protein
MNYNPCSIEESSILAKAPLSFSTDCPLGFQIILTMARIVLATYKPTTTLTVS